MQEKQNKMGQMPMGKLVASMSLPLMLSLLVQSLYNIVDSIFVARLGEETLTATSLAFPVQMLMIAFSVGTSIGINALLSRTLGAGNQEKATQIANTGMALAIVASLLFAVSGILFSKQLVGLFTQTESTAVLCRTYLRIQKPLVNYCLVK